jgi:hypothetical protein
VSTLALVLIAVGAVLLVLFLGGVLYTILRERRTRDLDAHRIAEADRALATARATDRGWDRALLEQAAHAALAQERPGLSYDALELTLVDDAPGVTDDRAHLVASSPEGPVRVVLCRDEGGWKLERIA